MSWLAGYSYRKPLVLTGGASGAQTDFQLNIDIAHVAAKMQADFDDIRFTQNNGTTLIDAWLESKVDSTSAETWAEFPTTPANTVESTYYMYYGKADAASDWDGAATFLQYHGAATADFLDSLIVSPTNVVYEGKIKRIGASNLLWGIANATGMADDYLLIQSYTEGNLRYVYAGNEGTNSSLNEGPAPSDGVWVKAKITCDGTTVYGYIDDNEIGSGGISTNIPNENLGLTMWEASGSGAQDWSFARKYAANPPTYAFGAEESAPPAFIPQIIIM